MQSTTALNAPPTGKIRRPFNTHAERTAYLSHTLIRTERFVIRSLRDGDAETFSTMLQENDYTFPRYIGWSLDEQLKQDCTAAGCRNYMIEHFNRTTPRLTGSNHLFIFRAGSNEIIGRIAFYHDRIGNPKTSCYIRDKFRGKGYAAEAIAVAQEKIFMHEHRSFHFAETYMSNTKSVNALRRAGFKLVGHGLTLSENAKVAGTSSIRFKMTRSQLRQIAQRPKNAV